MKRSVILLVAMASAGFASLVSAEMKIGVVNTNLLMRDAPQASAAFDVLRREFSARDAELKSLQQLLGSRRDKLEKDGATMTELQRSQAEKDLRDSTRELQLKQNAYDEDVETRRNEELQKLQRVLVEEVGVFAKAQGYDLILADGVVFVAPTHDVTASLLDSLKKKAGVSAAPAAAPAKPAAAPAKPPAAPAKP